MILQVLKSKIHNAVITELRPQELGGLLVDEKLMNSARLVNGEQVHVINANDGERMIIDISPVKAGSGHVCVCGSSATKFRKGDKISIVAYGEMTVSLAKQFKPEIILLEEGNIPI
jgi:aspartate 1-decarboxylase